MNSDTYDRGIEKIREIYGEAGEGVVKNLKDISPDFAIYIIEFPFGEIYSRSGLDLKSREIAILMAIDIPNQTSWFIRNCLLLLSRLPYTHYFNITTIFRSYCCFFRCCFLFFN